jgi:hypothetical protein
MARWDGSPSAPERMQRGLQSLDIELASPENPPSLAIVTSIRFADHAANWIAQIARQRADFEV